MDICILLSRLYSKLQKLIKASYIKDEKALEEYILEDGKINSKIKKGSAEYKKFIEDQREKLSIQRFKGLGEMNPEELWETTLNPDNRTMLRYNIPKEQRKNQRKIKK